MDIDELANESYTNWNRKQLVNAEELSYRRGVLYVHAYIEGFELAANRAYEVMYKFLSNKVGHELNSEDCADALMALKALGK